MKYRAMITCFALLTAISIAGCASLAYKSPPDLARIDKDRIQEKIGEYIEIGASVGNEFVRPSGTPGWFLISDEGLRYLLTSSIAGDLVVDELAAHPPMTRGALLKYDIRTFTTGLVTGGAIGAALGVWLMGF